MSADPSPTLDLRSFMAHASAQRWEVLSSALHSGLDVRTVTSGTGCTILHWAAGAVDRAGDLDTTLLALRHGANPTGRNQFGQTPVWWAAFLGKAEVLRALVAAGGSVNTPADTGETPLIALAKAGLSDAPRRLGVLLEAPDLDLLAVQEGRTAEEWARERGFGALADMVAAEVGSLRDGRFL